MPGGLATYSASRNYQCNYEETARVPARRRGTSWRAGQAGKRAGAMRREVKNQREGKRPLRRTSLKTGSCVSVRIEGSGRPQS